MASLLEMISFPDPARPAEAFRAAAELAAARGTSPGGFTRHLSAIIADESRVKRLATIKAPTLVIHGAADPLVPAACRVSTAESIPGARLEIIEEMAHDIPPSQVETIAGMIADHVWPTESGSARSRQKL